MQTVSQNIIRSAIPKCNKVLKGERATQEHIQNSKHDLLTVGKWRDEDNAQDATSVDPWLVN